MLLASASHSRAIGHLGSVLGRPVTVGSGGRYLFVEQGFAHGARGARDGGRDLGGFVGHGWGVAVDALESRVRGEGGRRAMAARMVVSLEFALTRTWQRIADDRDLQLAQLFSVCQGAAHSHASHGRLAVSLQQNSFTGAILWRLYHPYVNSISYVHVVPTANTHQNSAGQPAPTRPRLQSVSQDFSTLNEQIRQVAHIIRLPEDWTNTEDESARSSALRHVVRARAEWVLRWLLDKLKDDTDLGAEARALPVAWQLLECMLYMLPVSRSAPHLRDASFTTILERTLVETFDKDIESPADDASAHARDASESSEAVHDDAQPSRKRKRTSPGTSPSKKTALGVTDPVLLFRVVRLTLRSITGLTAASTKSHDTTQTELMKMVLRTESAQAARILKFWLTGVQKLVASTAQLSVDSLVDLSVVLDIWELRIVDASDNSGSSSEDFANECLVPTLQLAETLKNIRPRMGGQPTRVLDQTAQALDRLLTRHILAPARSTFFAETHAEAVTKDASHKEATALSSTLGPLRAMLLQAIQIEDAGEAIPTQFAASFKAVGNLLDLAIRASPSRTPKSRLAERPWIQAVFVSLAECVACSLKSPPELATSKAAVVTLQSALEVLQSHAITMDSAILKNVFWFHCGVKYPETEDRQVHWTLIAALIELDASIFVTTPRSASQESGGHNTDLVEFLFDQISHTEFKGAGFVNLEEEMDIDMKDGDGVITDTRLHADRQLILKRIVTPIMSAYSRNRNLLGFLRRWDDQLVKSYKPANRKALKEGTDSVWEDRLLIRALMETFEQSLTHGQIATLVEEHAQRMDALGDAMTTQAGEDVKIRKSTAYKKAASSALLIPAVLQSMQSDDVIIALKPQLHSLFVSYAARVQDGRFGAFTRLDFSWTTLCQLLAKLWPVEMHASLQLQQQLLHPLMEQATKDVSTSRKDPGARRVDSQTRAAAMLFLLDSCNRVQTVPGSQEQVRNGLSKAIQNLSASRLEASEYTNMVEIFCANFVQLLGHLDAPTSQESLLAILTKLSLFEDNVGDNIVTYLSQSVFSQGNSSLHSAYTLALSDALGQNDDSHSHHVIVEALRQVQPSALSREKREAILDRLSALISASPHLVESLSLMVQLMEVPNASAKISIDGAVVFDIAAQVQKQGLPSPALLQQLQSLCQKVLGHIIPNQSQAQSRAFLGEYQKKLNTLTEGKKKVSSASLAILRATVLEQKDSLLLSLKQYVGLLKQCLTDDGTDANDTASFEDVMDAFIELFPALLADPTLLKTTTAWLRNWINENADLESYVNSSQTGSVEVAEFVARLHRLVAKYRLYPDTKWLVALTVKLLCGPLPAELKRIALTTTTEALTPLETAEKLSLVPLLAEVNDPLGQSASFCILKDLISTLPDKVSTDATLKKEQLAILPRLCYLLADTSNEASFNALMDSIDTILNNKASLTTQHSIECVLTVLVRLTSRTSPALSATSAPHIFTRLCETSRLVLLVHRNKSGGRSHLLLPLLQGLLFCLFMPTSARSGALPSWLRSNTPTEPVCLTPTNAAQFTRLLSTLCNPPQSTISKAHQRSSRNSKDLNDPVKAAREKTSHFLYPFLASLCRFQLSGRLLPAVRTKLMPGLWEVVGTASLHKEGLDAMFAGLSRSEKDVWRSVWGEYESVHGRKERFVGEE
jgi:nucleolar pre-ribosomal-associated protein 2